MEELRPSTTLSHYRIVSKLGAGGMGEVYLAQDTKLDRKVALKILPADVAENKNRMDRFVREAKAAAALNHPNIAHVYEIGESDGTHFIAMEYIDGETLREKIHRDRTPLPKLLKYLNQVAEGLAKAHNAGIVHRDLKPDNVMITRDDYAKVLDFGLAKLIEGQGDTGTGGGGEDPTIALSPRRPISTSLSTPGIVMGTVGYMSPEQASGRIDEIDHRSDIFSLGCILFEAATGKRAFDGKDALDSLHKIVYAPTPQLKDINPFAPDDLQRVVRRCLAKEPEKRYQSIKEVAIEIDDLRQELKDSDASDYSRSQASPTIVQTSGASRTDEGFWVAVLPFKYRGSNVDLEALAEGLSEDIVTGLSRFSYLKVVARSSTLSSTSEIADVRAAGKELGARYIVEGSLRLAGTTLRVSVQLVDTVTGTHLWAETYDRVFRSDDVFALQDELVPRIVSTVADQHGVLIHSIAEELRHKAKDQFNPYDAVLSVFGFHERMTPEEHASLRDVLERIVRDFPDQGNCWAMLETLYCDEYMFGFNVRLDPLGRAVAAAQRAVELAPTSNLASQALTQALFFRRELVAFRPVAERTITLNPMDGATVAFMGLLIACSGDWEKGCAFTESAMQLNPHFPGWYRLASIFNAYRQKDYRATVDGTLRVNIPGYFWTLLMSAAAHGQLGNTTEAQRSLRELLKSRPEFISTARDELGKWFPQEFIEHLIEGLQKAGLDAAANLMSSRQSDASPQSSETRSDGGFWVAVLPFKFTGSNTEVATLAEGLSEEIVTGLSRFSYLRVISRSSTLRYANETDDVRTVGKTVGARYVMEGSLRVAGSSLRISVQLIDASTGAHLWAETYDRQFRAEDVFALQDDLVPRIVSTVADVNGVLPRSMSDAVCSKNPDELSPYEAVLRSFRYFDRVNAEELAAARSCLEIAVKNAPTNADAWAMLALLFAQDYGQGFNLHSDALNSGTMAAQRAVEVGPSNHLAHFSLAQARFFQKEVQSFRNSAERAVALNPMDANSLAFVGELFTYVGDYERGLALATRAKQINPNHPGWFWYADFFHAYRQGDYSGALSLILKANLPGHWGMHAGIAACAGQLGERETATKAVRDLLKLQPHFGSTVNNTLAKWFDPELCEQLLDGLRKAGLEIAGEEPGAETRDIAQRNAAPKTIPVPSFESRPAIAVLPFDNLSADPDQEYFADGLAEDLITRLSLWRSFPVIARNSSFIYKGRAVDLKKVSAELGVRYVVQGSVRKAGKQLRISAQLIDATTGHQAWARTYDRELTDVFAVQDEISEAIAASLVGDLQRVEYGRAKRRAPENLEAWLLYQRALPHIYRFTREDSAEARDLLERSTALDPQFSTAFARLSELGFWDYLFMWTNSPQQTLDNAVAQARRAVDLDSRDAEARAQLGLVLMTAGFGEEALEAARRGLDLNPSMPFALLVYAYILHMTGHPPDESIELTKRAMRLSPQDPAEFLFYDVLSSAYLNAGRYSEGLATGRRLIALLPSYYWGYIWSAMNAVGLDQIEDARALIREARRIVPELSITVVRQALGAMAPEVDRHFSDALHKAGLPEVIEDTTSRRDEETQGLADVGKDEIDDSLR